MTITNYPKGSEWRKWDLHIHTPFSYLNHQFGDNFDIYVQKLFKEAIEKHIAAIGITDYFCIEGYKKIKNDYLKKNEKLAELFSQEEIEKIKKIKLFPNIEFRLTTLVGSNRLNYHVIFSDTVSVKDIEENFLHELDFVYEGNPDSQDEKWKLKIGNIESLGKRLKQTHPPFQGQTDLFIGMQCAVVRDGQITDLLNNKKSKFQDKYVLCVPADEDLSCLSWNGQDHNVRKVLIQKTHLLFSSNAGTIAFGLGEKHPTPQAFIDEFKTFKACIWGSDAHSYEKLFVPDLSRYTWIKAEITFEGLKQVIYEPQSRVYIGPEEPIRPVNTIDTIKFNIPTGVKIGQDKFCFSGNQSEYFLSPYFNCFIGGRGSGKSTILNFLGLRSSNPDSSKEFWFGNGKDKKGLNPVGFKPDNPQIFSFAGTEIFEFLAQSEIENFARDKARFTQAVYTRANALASNILETYEIKISNLQLKIDQIIDAVSELKKFEEIKKVKEKEKRTLESSIKILSSPEYRQIIAEITEKSKELQRLDTWKEMVTELRDKLDTLIANHSTVMNVEPINKDAKSDYAKAYFDAVTKINEAISLLNEANFSEAIKVENEIKDALKILEEQSKSILEKANLSTENVIQIQSAPQNITLLDGEIKKLSQTIAAQNKVLDGLEKIISDLMQAKTNYEEKIIEILKPLQDLLKRQFEENQGADIRQISLEYFFDAQKSWNALADEFYNLFKETYGDSERGKEVTNFMASPENRKPFLSNDLNSILKHIKQVKPKFGHAKYVKFFEEVFSDPINFQIFKAIRARNLHDVKTNTIIQVKYDNKDVEQASFGQRCTSVVVIMLLFGNYPLIIDEPEAHLDSSLIANYLVPMLKKKKTDRQIIFATHNANFVINGDAEKIFILKNDTGTTEIIETTIENIDNRDELLKLEGGREAFEKRGVKLNIKQ